jgi:small multidrug resistance family-3 protein
MTRVLYYLALFIAAAFELSGCDSFWRWLHDRGTVLWVVPGVLAYAIYGGMQTR